MSVGVYVCKMVRHTSEPECGTCIWIGIDPQRLRNIETHHLPGSLKSDIVLVSTGHYGTAASMDDVTRMI